MRRSGLCHSHKFVEFAAESGEGDSVLYGTDFALDAVEPRRLREAFHDMRPIDIAVARQSMLVGACVVVVQMAVHYVWEHLLDGVVRPVGLEPEPRPAVAGSAFFILFRIGRQDVGVSCIVAETEGISRELILDVNEIVRP